MTDTATERHQDRADADSTPTVEEGNRIVGDLLAAGDEVARKELVKRYGRSERWWGYRKEAVEAANAQAAAKHAVPPGPADLAVTTADRRNGTLAAQPAPAVASTSVHDRAVAEPVLPLGTAAGKPGGTELAADQHYAVTTADRHDGATAAALPAPPHGTSAAADTRPAGALTSVPIPDPADQQASAEAADMQKEPPTAPDGATERLSGPFGHLGDSGDLAAPTAVSEEQSLGTSASSAPAEREHAAATLPTPAPAVAPKPDAADPGSTGLGFAATNDFLPHGKTRHAVMPPDRHHGMVAASDVLPDGMPPAAEVATAQPNSAVATARRHDGTTAAPNGLRRGTLAGTEIADSRRAAAVTTVDRLDGKTVEPMAARRPTAPAAEALSPRFTQRRRRVGMALVLVSCAAAMTTSGWGMWTFFDDLGKLPLPLVGAMFLLFDSAAVACAWLARINRLQYGRMGIEGWLVWLFAALSGLMSASDANGGEAWVRFLAPMVAAVMFELLIRGERRDITDRDGPVARIKRRMLARFGLLDDVDQDDEQAARSRMAARLATLAYRVHQTPEGTRARRKAVARYHRKLRLASERMQFATNTDMITDVRIHLDALYRSVSGTSAASVVDLNVWHPAADHELGERA